MVNVLLRRIANNLFLSAHKFSERAVSSPEVLRAVSRHAINFFESVLVWTRNMIEEGISIELFRILERLIFFRAQNGSVGSTILLYRVGSDFRIAGT